MRSIKQLRILLPLSLAILLVFDSCKKDPFNEQDAIAAQKELLQMKFNYDLAIANVGLQIQRAGDSARIAIQNSINTTALSLKLAEYNYLLSELKYRDSLQRVQDYVNRVGGLKNYTVRVVDAMSKAPISGATVRVLPWGTSSFVSLKTNSDGLATFTNVVLDPSAIFYAIDENAGVTSATTMIRRNDIEANYTMPVYRYTGTSGTGAASSSGVLMTGQLRANLDATNTSYENLGAGHTVTASTTILASTLNSLGLESPNVTWSFAGLTSATGSYSIRVPVGYTYTVSASLTTSTWKQKMYANFIEGVDDPFTAVPRVDSTDVYLSSSSLYSYYTVPSVYSYYIKLPADSLKGSPIYMVDKSTSGFMGTLLSKIVAQKTATGKYLDTLPSSDALAFSIPRSSMKLGNDWSDDFYAYKLRVDTFVNAVVPDTLDAELVVLNNYGIVKTAPALSVITTTGGKVNKIIFKRSSPGVLVEKGSYDVTNGFWGDNSWTFADVMPYLNNRAYTPTTPNASLSVTVSSAATTSQTGKNIFFGVLNLVGYNSNYSKIK